jgi:hypothetical protein
MPMHVRSGDRFRVTRDAAQHVTVIRRAPSHTTGVDSVVPAGTVVVALDQVPGASAFLCYPEDYDGMESAIVPAETRHGDYFAYALSFAVRDIGEVLEPMEPLAPRPPNRIPHGRG